MLRYQKNPPGKRKTGEIEVDGKLYKAKYIGKGQYSRVYRVGDRVVYYTRGDCGKEVLAQFQYDRMMHLSEIIRHENITTVRGTWYVFSSPWYRNVTMKDRSAWRLMHDIIDVYKEFWNQERDYQYQAYGRVKANIDVMQKFVEYASRMSFVIPKSVVKALQEIVNVASNCGPIVGFDFTKQNFGVNQYGVLIFRDPFYVWE